MDDLMDELTDAVVEAIGDAEGWPKVTHIRRHMQDRGLYLTRAAPEELERLRKALGACQRYALRIAGRDAGHALDRTNAQAIVDVAGAALANASKED